MPAEHARFAEHTSLHVETLRCPESLNVPAPDSGNK
jgi:hypothetical protein